MATESPMYEAPEGSYCHECGSTECCCDLDESAWRRAYGPSDPLDDGDKDQGPEEFTESREGHDARERWARRYDDLNGAPENDGDR